LPGFTEGYTAATYCILNEDHTLGNLLRWMIMKKYVPGELVEGRELTLF
jgi:DNA-directed RNA polymerase subunit L